MPLLARTVNTPLMIEVRRGAVAQLGQVLADGRISSGGDVAVVVGPGLGERVLELVRPSLSRAEVFTIAGGSVDSALDLAAQLRGRSYDAVVGIGGGRTIDTAKYAATRLGLPMVSVATSLAQDGMASPTASLVEHDGVLGSYGVHIPIAVIVDLDFVETGPGRSSRAGIGELVSNISALADWELARTARGETVDGLAVTLARVGAEAVLNHPGDLDDDGFVTLLAEALISSGLAMAACGSTRPVSGGCHEISHAIDRLFPGTAMHGEQVGVGALFCTHLRGDRIRLAQLSRQLARHGLPRIPAELGLTNEQFVEAVAYAPQTRPDRYTILEHRALTPAQIQSSLEEFLDVSAVND